MQNFLFKHVGALSFHPNAQAALPIAGTVAPLSTSGPNYIEGAVYLTEGGSGGQPLVFIAKCGDFSRSSVARGARHAITSRGCFQSEGQQMIAYAFRCQLPAGTDPRSLTYEDFRANASNFMFSPIVGNNGLNTISWEDCSSLDVVPGGDSVDVYYGVILRPFGAAATAVTGVISCREVVREFPIFQPLK